MSLNYSYINLDHKTSIPPRSVNGGLYTGQPSSGPWANVPIIPDSHIMIDTHYINGFQLPPPDMKYQAVSTIRPGNNSVTYPHHIMCTTMGINSMCANS